MRAPSGQPPHGGHHPGPPTPTPRQPQGTLGSSPGWEPFSGTRGWGWNAGADSRSPPARSEAGAPLDSAGLVSAASGSGTHGTDRPQPPALPQCPRSGGHAPCSPGRDGQVSTGTACLYSLLPPGTAPYPLVPTACSWGGGALRAPGLLGGPGQLQWASCSGPAAGQQGSGTGVLPQNVAALPTSSPPQLGRRPRGRAKVAASGTVRSGRGPSASSSLAQSGASTCPWRLVGWPWGPTHSVTRPCQVAERWRRSQWRGHGVAGSGGRTHRGQWQAWPEVAGVCPEVSLRAPWP